MQENRERQEPQLRRADAEDRALAVQSLDAQDEVRHQEFDQRAPIEPVPPLQGRRHPVLKTERPIRDARHVRRGEREEESEKSSSDRSERDRAERKKRSGGTDGGLEEKRDQAEHRAVEGSAEPVELGATLSDLPADLADQTFEDARTRHARPAP